ncbi:MAG TPA: hypothetical protein PK388_06515 [Kiritimatiellia bacterium]|nr:hypothetical protein [Kiritimatiellia bacterium]
MKTSDRVMETVWPWWKTPAGQVAESCGRRALIQAAILAAVGAGLRFGLHREIMAGVAWGMGALIAVSGFFLPSLFRALERLGGRLGHGTGVALTYLLLVPFYFLVFVPARAALALRGKDPMQRRFPAPEASCWTPKKTNPKLNHYRKQFS